MIKIIKGAIQKAVNRENLTEEEIIQVMNCIMDGHATEAQIGSFITALRMKGETIEEITGCAKVMREKAERIVLKANYYIDTCGTGGDGSGTYNISTAAAIVASAGGAVIAKHGNRASSSKSGSADVMEKLGINISLTSEKVRECIEKIGIGFIFAPLFHKSMKYAAGPRKELGIRTIFNILGPLTNPCGAKGQVMGIFNEGLTELVAEVLRNLNTERAMVIHGMDGLDEITTAGETKVSEVKDGRVFTYKINPEDYGFKKASKDDYGGGNAKENADIIKDIFKGKEKGPKRDILLINSAAALYVGKIAENLEGGIKMATDIIDSGKAMKKLSELKNFTGTFK